MMFSKIPMWFMQFNVVDLLNQWEAVGIFSHVLPFLLIFAVVFGVLQHSAVLGHNKGVNLVVSLVLGLLAIQYLQVTTFIGAIFANLGIALSVILVLIILTGLFVSPDNRKMWTKTVFGIALVSVAVVVIASLNDFYWFGSYWWQDNWVSIVWVAIFLLIIGAFLSGSDKDKNPWGPFEPVRKMLSEGS